MDSLTQIALGGAVGYAVLGNKIGRKAILYGAALGTLPDLDVLIPYAGDVESFTYHRGFSHSIWVHLLISPFIAWILSQFHPSTAHLKIRWFALVFLTLSTHALLDSLTVYGTQLMWPFTEYPYGVSNLFIIDPLYTLPLLFGLGIALALKAPNIKAIRANKIGLVLSTAYISWSLIAKVMIDNKVELAMEQQRIEPIAYVSTPAPLNTLLWRVVAVSESNSNTQYHEIYASVFDDVSEVSFQAYLSSPMLLDPLSDDWAINRLAWFTKGVYSVKRQGDNIIMSALRMGVECNYVFNFVVAQTDEKGIQAVDPKKVSARPDFASIGNIWDRIWDSSVNLSPSMPCEPLPLDESN
jgi:inner membrane protein